MRYYQMANRFSTLAKNVSVVVALSCLGMALAIDECPGGRGCLEGEFCARTEYAHKERCLPCNMICYNGQKIHNSKDCQDFCPRFLQQNPDLYNQGEIDDETEAAENSSNYLIFFIASLMFNAVLVVVIVLIVVYFVKLRKPKESEENEQNKKLIAKPTDNGTYHDSYNPTIGEKQGASCGLMEDNAAGTP